MDACSDGTSPTGESRRGGDVIWLHDPAAGPSEEPLDCSPVELFAHIDAAVARAGLDNVAVTGMVKGLRRRARWCGFELTQQRPRADSPDAVVRVVLFAAALAEMDDALAAEGRTLRDGMRVTVLGALRTDAPWGAVRVVARGIEAHEDLAAAARRRDALVASLAAEGLLWIQASLDVPARPRHIAVVAGAGTAAAADVRTLLDASGVEWNVSHRSVPMAGPAAPRAVAEVLARLARARPDVIVLARGGGGASELACWDSEVVARAIAACPVPVWTAIGHATDTTVADRVANRSCPTPSAAAAALTERAQAAERHRNEQAVLRKHAAHVRALRRRARRASLVAALAVVAVVAVVLLTLR